jgi:Flp pilus assembly protein TadD
LPLAPLLQRAGLARAGRAAVLLLACCAVAASAWADAYDDAAKLYRDGQVEQALALADKTLATQPRDARMRFLKGVMLSEQQRQAEAIAVFVALTEDFPELADPYNNLAVLYAADGRLQAALGALQAALRNDPAHRTARENLGNVHVALALEAWGALPAGPPAEQADLQRRMRLAREILQPPAASRPGG